MSNIKDLEKMTVVQLKDDLVKKGLSADGKKADLVKRLSEYLIQAEEDALLNGTTASDIATDDLLKADDLLGDNDVLGDLPPLDDEPKTEAVASPVKESASAEATTEQSEKTKISAPVDETMDAKVRRAQRFGLPIGTEAQPTVLEAKKRRAERFGITSPVVDAASLDEAKAKRAERFGIPAATSPAAKMTANAPVDESTKAKLLLRAQRFGIPVSADGKTLASDSVASPDALAKRAARFGGAAATTNGAGDSEVEAKKKARLERFGVGAV